MKKIIVYLSLLAFTFVNAQNAETNTTDVLTFDKGTQFTNLYLAFSRSNSETTLSNQEVIETKQNIFSIRSSYAYAVSTNFFLGLGLGYGHNTYNTQNKTTNAGNSSYVGNRYRIFPYVRYYKGVGEKLAIYLQGEASYNHSNIGNLKTNSFSTGLRPGVTYMIHKNLALNGSFGYLGYSTGNTEDEENQLTVSNSKALRFSLTSSELLFGLNYYF